VIAAVDSSGCAAARGRQHEFTVVLGAVTAAASGNLGSVVMPLTDLKLPTIVYRVVFITKETPQSIIY
jgi:hypothetical protein